MQRKMPRHPNNSIQVHVKNVTIISKVKRNLRRLAKAPKLIEHIEKKADWPEGVFHTIDCETHRTSILNIDLPNRFVTKFVHNMLPTGNRVHLYKTYYDDRCPSCFAEQEDRRHLLTCPDPERRKWKSKVLKELREACDRTDVGQPMIQILVDGLYHELDDCQMENTTSHPDNLQQLIVEQNNIGW